MSSNEVKELSDVIGVIGLHQVLTMVSTVFMTSTFGISGVFVQLLAPVVELSWRTDAGNRTDMHWNSTNCDRHQIDLSKPSENSTLFYYSKYSRHTLTEKFDLVCERSWLISLSSSLLMIGGLVAYVLFGQISERFGRKRTLYIGCALYIISNLVILFAVNMAMFTVGCVFNGGASTVLAAASFVTYSELIPNKYRSPATSFYKTGMVIGQLFTASCSWIFEDWFYVQTSQAIFAAFTIPATWCILESPIWLTVKGKEDQAKDCVKIIIRRNGKEKGDDDIKIAQWIASVKNQSSIAQSANEGRLTDLLKTPTIRKYFLSLNFLLFSVAFAYYGLVMNTETFGTDLYVDYMISSGVAMLSVLISTVALFKLSCRNFTILFLFGLVISCSVYTLTLDFAVARTVVATIARLFVTAPLGISYIIVMEVLPTSVRGVGFGIIGAVSRTASALSPFTKELGDKTATFVPIILFASLNLISIFLLWNIIPDTHRKPLVNTVKDLENKQLEIKAKRKRDALDPTPTLEGQE